MYKKEMDKFKETVNSMKNEVISIVAQTLLEATQRLQKQCEDNKPNQRTLNNLNKFLEQIEVVYSDFIDRADIKSVIEKVQKSVLGVDADSLREAVNFKELFQKEMEEAAKTIVALPDLPLKRALDFE
jgi:hypothetical protein